MWWVASTPGGTRCPGLPRDTFTAAGNGGRFLTVIPSRPPVVALQPIETPGHPPPPLYPRKGAYTDLLADLVGRA